MDDACCATIGAARIWPQYFRGFKITGHDPARGSDLEVEKIARRGGSRQEVLEILRVGSGQEVFKDYGSGWITLI